MCIGKGSICGSSGIFSCKCSDTVVSVPSGPTRIQQLRLFCLECEHSGEIGAMTECPQCKGNKVIDEKKAFKFHIKKGMRHGDEIEFPGQADEAPDTVTGDVIFVVQEEEHPIFKRKFDNLYVEYKVELAEARCGFQRFLTHLDGRQLLIKSDLGEIIKSGDEKIIYNEGMPHEGYQVRKGLLFVLFNVELPNSGAGCGEASSTSNCADLNHPSL